MKRPGKFTAALIIMALTALIVTAGPVSAYFSDHIEATGKVPVELGFTTWMDERVDGLVKTITITNEGPERCFVRAKAYSGDNLKLDYQGEGWTRGASDDWYYYGPVLEAEQKTAPLKVTISEVPEDAEAGDSFNVVVVYESVKALYKDNGEPAAADWSMKGIEGSGD